MKKLLSIILVITILMSAFMTLGFSAGAEESDVLAVTVNGVTTEVPVGDTFTYTYALTDLRLLNTEAVVNFDSDYVAVIAADENDDDAYDAFKEKTFPLVYAAAVCNVDLQDKILYNFSNANGYRFVGEQVLAVFEFEALAAGETTIETEIIEMVNYDKEYIVDKTENGSVQNSDFTYNEYVTYVEPEEPTEIPTDAPTDAPTDEPTDAPTEAPTNAPPIKISNIVATPSTTSVSLTWDACEGATKYWIYKYSESDATYKLYTSSKTTSATVSGYTYNKTYKLKVIASLSNLTMQKLDDADVVQFTTLPPPVVEGLIATPDTTSVHLQWEPVEGAQRYWIYKCFEKGGPFYCYDSTTNLEYTIKRLQPDSTYYFKIVPAVLSPNGNLMLGAPESAQELEATTTSGEVITTKIVNVTSTTATITWPAFENAVKYWVMVSTTTKSTSNLSDWLSWTTTTDTTFTIPSRVPGKYYYYSVVALYNDEETGTQETVNYVGTGTRMPYSDDNFITFTPVDEDTVTLTWPEEAGATKTWVSYYNEQGKEVVMLSTTENSATLNLKNYQNYSYALNALDSSGFVGYLTPSGGEKYHE